jgi:hypothetical protein
MSVHGAAGALPARLDGWQLRAARTSWLAVVIGSTVFVAVGFGRALADPQLIALPALTDLFAALGLDLRLMIVVALLVPFVTVVVICGLVFRRRSDDPMALLFTLTLLLSYAFSSRTPLTYSDHAVLRHSVSVLFVAAMLCLILVLGLFPDGRWTPRWSRWQAVAATTLVAAFPDSGRLLMDLLDDGSIGGPTAPVVGGWCVLIALGVLAQTHRYRRVSGLVERQQTKWVVFPLGLMMTLFVVVLLLAVLRPGPPDRWLGAVLFVVVPLGILLPVTVANAVLRHRLFEIDRAISRTLSYAVLTAVLAGLYALSVTGLGAIVRALTGGGGGDLVVAASTLAVAALFQPLRRRVQSLVDRRFSRARYDAQRTVEAFAQRLRDEVDLDALADQLRSTASTTMQPRGVSLWLRLGDSMAPPSPEPADEGRYLAGASSSAGRVAAARRPAAWPSSQPRARSLRG